SETDGEYYAYHGYWASNFEKLNPHLGSLADFHELIDAAAEKGINIVVDVVLNHAGYGTEETFAGMVRTKEEDKQGDDQLGSLSGLPDFKTEEAAVRNQLVAWQASWLERSTTAKGNSIYAFRVDTVKHVDDITWQHFKNELVDR
ncbi:alpha-amylase family glycosyl hydrolase, partial [Streptococcus suis]